MATRDSVYAYRPTTLCIFTSYGKFDKHESKQLTVWRSPRFTERQPDVLVVLEFKHRLDLFANLIEQLLGYRSDRRVLAWIGHSGGRTTVIQELKCCTVN